MTDKLHTFSLGEICEPVDTNYRKAKRSGERDSRGRNMPVRKRKFQIDVNMTVGEFESFKKQICKLADEIYQRRGK